MRTGCEPCESSVPPRFANEVSILSGAVALGACECTPRIGLDEGQQLLVDLVLVRCAQPMWCALVDFQRGAFDELGGEQPGIRDRHNLIVVAVHDESRNVDLL